MWDEYFSAKSVHEVLEILRSYRGQARIIAGGTDLIPEMKKGIGRWKSLVDISEIAALKKIERDGDTIKIGAGITHGEVAASLHMPKVEVGLSEPTDPTGHFCAKEIGEPSTLGVAPAIANAIYDAIGVRFTEIPITPEKVFKVLVMKRKNSELEE